MTPAVPAAPPDRVPESDDFWHLRLYVADGSPKSLRALANLKRMCEEHLASRYEIEVVDLVEEPSRAKDDEIMAIPTLVRRLPAPVRRIIGDLRDSESVLVGLQVTPKDDEHD